MIKKKITILGSTGSIGTQALDIISQSASRFEIVALSCNSNIEKMVEQVKVFTPKYAVIYDESKKDELSELLKDTDTKVLSGMTGLIYISTLDSIDMLLTAVVGNIGLIPTYKAVEKGIDIALANKETLVTAGQLIMPLAKKTGSQIIPVDSEHSAIYQCIIGNQHREIEKILLTASGGPFRKFDEEEIKNAKAKDALKHPTWNMGNKITIDSATLMNKGLELIEARWLFDIDPENIEPIIHPESIIHSMVQYVDSSVIGQMGLPDMRLPIIYALDHTARHHNTLERIDFTKIGQMTFEKPNLEKFPCLKLAMDAIKVAGTMPTVLNAANEELVYMYLRDEISFYEISDYIEQMMLSHDVILSPTIDDIYLTDIETRKKVKDAVNNH